MISTLPARRGGLILALCVVAILCGPAAARKVEAREGKGLARSWEGWKIKAMQNR